MPALLHCKSKSRHRVRGKGLRVEGIVGFAVCVMVVLS